MIICTFCLILGDLCSHLMELMFPENEDQPILSENRDLFRLVMSTLHNYEMLVSLIIHNMLREI